ncbi:MAG TPA: ribose-phosphate pyrophosphokinase-like domain-containing protein, partial [Candidatus Omnitrophota bacterium]|nr:ribose-phosphate pyrophosphokinase-like domain-containing protein [Candidatus Omnitrophota bacterium]
AELQAGHKIGCLTVAIRSRENTDSFSFIEEAKPCFTINIQTDGVQPYDLALREARDIFEALQKGKPEQCAWLPDPILSLSLTSKVEESYASFLTPQATDAVLPQVLRHFPFSENESVRMETVYQVSALNNEDVNAHAHDLILFKIGHEKWIKHFAEILSHRIRQMIPDLSGWILAFRKSTPEHATQRLGDYIAASLGAEVVYLEQKKWPVGYVSMSAQERYKAVENSTVVLSPEKVAGKKVIIIDDVIHSGGVLKDLAQTLIILKAKEVFAFVLFDSGDVSFEVGIYPFLQAHPSLLKEAIIENQGRLSLGGIKYLMQFIRDSRTAFLQATEGLSRDVRYELVKRSLQYLDIVPRQYEKDLLHALLSIWAADIYQGLSLSNKLEVLTSLKDVVSRGILANGERTLFVSAQEWESSSKAVFYAYVKGYDFLVFRDRRAMSSDATEEALEAARLFHVFLASPYYTTLPRSIYAKQENQGFAIAKEQKDFLSFLAKAMKNIRNAHKARILELSLGAAENDAPSAILKASKDYAQQCAKIFQDVCESLIDFLRKKNIAISKNDLAIAFVGSLARGEVTEASDIDFDIIAKDEETAKIIEGSVALALTHFLRLAGFDVGPSDELYQRHIKTRYELKTHKLFDERMRAEDRPSTLIRFCDYTFAWGNPMIFHAFTKRGKSEILCQQGPCVLMIEQAANEYIDIAKNGHGRFSGRNFIVAYDTLRRISFDVKWIINLVEISLKEFVIRNLPLLSTDKHFSWDSLPKQKSALLTFFKEHHFLNGIDDQEIEKVKNSYAWFLEYRQQRAARGELNTACPFEPGFIDHLNILGRFILRHIIAQRIKPAIIKEHNIPFVSNELGQQIGVYIGHFPDGEIHLSLENPDDVKDSHIKVIHALETSHDLVQLVLLAGALKTYHAKELTLVVPQEPSMSRHNGYRYVLYYYFDHVMYQDGKDIPRLEIFDRAPYTQAVRFETVLYQHGRFGEDAREAAARINIDHAKIDIVKIEDNPLSWQVCLPFGLNGKHVALIHSTENTEDIVELWFILVALHRANVGSISLINTCEGYSRQDKIFEHGQAVSAKTILDATDGFLSAHAAFNIHYGKQVGWVALKGHDILNLNAFTAIAQTMIDWIMKSFACAAELVQESQRHPILLLGPDDGSFPYVQEAVTAIKRHFRKWHDIDLDLYCGYLDKVRKSGTEVSIPDYILGPDGQRIEQINGLDVSEYWCLILDDETAYGSTLFAATYMLVRKLRFSWQRILAGVVRAKLVRGLEPFLTGLKATELSSAKEPVAVYVNEQKEHMPPRALFATESVALPKEFPEDQKIPIGPLVSYALRYLQGDIHEGDSSNGQNLISSSVDIAGAWERAQNQRIDAVRSAVATLEQVQEKIISHYPQFLAFWSKLDTLDIWYDASGFIENTFDYIPSELSEENMILRRSFNAIIRAEQALTVLFECATADTQQQLYNACKGKTMLYFPARLVQQVQRSGKKSSSILRACYHPKCFSLKRYVEPVSQHVFSFVFFSATLCVIFDHWLVLALSLTLAIRNYAFRDTTAFFRNRHVRDPFQDFYGNVVGGYIIPVLKKQGRSARIHSAGASDFKEAISIAIMLHEDYQKDPGSWGKINPLEHIKIYATEFDPIVFKRGKSFVYSSEQIRQGFSFRQQERSSFDQSKIFCQNEYFDEIKRKDGTIAYRLKPYIRSMIRIRQRNLKDAHPRDVDVVFFLHTAYLMGPWTLKRTIKNFIDSVRQDSIIVASYGHCFINPFSFLIKKHFIGYDQRYVFSSRNSVNHYIFRFKDQKPRAAYRFGSAVYGLKKASNTSAVSSCLWQEFRQIDHKLKTEVEELLWLRYARRQLGKVRTFYGQYIFVRPGACATSEEAVGIQDILEDLRNQGDTQASLSSARHPQKRVI